MIVPQPTCFYNEHCAFRYLCKSSQYRCEREKTIFMILKYGIIPDHYLHLSSISHIFWNPFININIPSDINIRPSESSARPLSNQISLSRRHPTSLVICRSLYLSLALSPTKMRKGDYQNAQLFLTL
jgi:hypothetical protein